MTSTAEPGSTASATRRVFFALWPEAPTRRAIERATRSARRRSGGRPTPPRDLHLTLAFLGSLGTAELERALALVPPEIAPFTLVLDRVGYLERARVLWLGSSATPGPLLTLEQRLWESLTSLGFERERRAFLPHVTLCRRARAVAEAGFRPVRWLVARIALVESVPAARGVHYEPLAFWPLAAAPRISPSGPETGGCEQPRSME